MNSAIIVAAGQGTRMGPGVDKLFLEVAGRPVVAHTWQRFNDAPGIDEIVIVVRDGMQSAFAELAREFNLAQAASFRRGWSRAAGLGLERVGGDFAAGRDRGDSGRRAAVHEPGVDRGHSRRGT